MPEGRLGGPRPGAQARIRMRLFMDEPFTAGDVVVGRDIENKIDRDVDVMSGVQGGLELLRGRMEDIEDAGYVVVVTVDTNEMTMEEVNMIADHIRSSATEAIDNEDILIGSTAEGFNGGPRPLAISSINVTLNSENETASFDEAALEGDFRSALDKSVDVTVVEGMRFPGPSITVITREQDVPLDEVNTIISEGRRITRESLPDRNIDISGT